MLFSYIYSFVIHNKKVKQLIILTCVLTANLILAYSSSLIVTISGLFFVYGFYSGVDLLFTTEVAKEISDSALKATLFGLYNAAVGVGGIILASLVSYFNGNIVILSKIKIIAVALSFLISCFV